MKITIDLLKYFGILLYNAPCIRLSAMTWIYYNSIVIHTYPPKIKYDILRKMLNSYFK